MDAMSDMGVVEKVKQRIADLEQAIQRLDYVKRHLNQNSSQIKSQIHTSISRQLETLRNREVWLLEQVDTVVGGKEEVLHGQQARLNKALGILHSSLSHAADSDDDAAARHLVQALEQLNNTELKAEETPYIAFRADQVSLRESILSYGRVDANGLPFLSAFADEDKPSASLPRHLEEYEDTEHHVFYKALQDGRPNSTSIRVTMPKLSSRVEDWLQRPMLQLSTSVPELQTPTSDQAGTPVSQTSCSIQHWLSQIKHNPDGEEDDDFEIVDHSGSSRRESPVEEECKPLPPVRQEESVDVFRHIPRDLRLWLLQGGSTRTGTGEEDLRAFFKHIPTDTSVWLATARRQLESLDELKRGGWFRHIPTETATWLRRVHDKRASAAQSAVPDMFAHIPRDNTAWLKNKATAQVEMQAQEARNMLKTGGEGKSSYLTSPSQPPAPQSSIPDLMKDYLSSAPSSKECWLLRSEAGAASATGEVFLSSLPGIQSYLNGNTNTNAWLASSVEEEEAEVLLSADTDSFFSHISRNKYDWLRDWQGKGGYSSPSCAINLGKASKVDCSRWLRSGLSRSTEKSSTIPASPIDSLRQSFSHMTTSDWLLGGERQDDDASKSWTVCSTESSLSSASSLQSVSSGRQAPPLDLAAWIYQKCL